MTSSVVPLVSTSGGGGGEQKKLSEIIDSESGGEKSGGGSSKVLFDPADMGTKQARVLFDYEAVNPQEISAVKGDVRKSLAIFENKEVFLGKKLWFLNFFRNSPTYMKQYGLK